MTGSDSTPSREPTEADQMLAAEMCHRELMKAVIAKMKQTGELRIIKVVPTPNERAV